MDLTSAVTRAALLVAVEGAALSVLGVGYGVAGLLGDPFDRAATLLEAGFAVIAGVLVLLVARGLQLVKGWSRSPAVVLQLLALPVGLGLVQGRVWYAAVPVLGLAGSVLYQLATPEARLAFRGLD
ncbi:MAG: rane protein [Frankiales bacterium]|nr:rane protein [Frankiales bacterium]